jgi:hypothetical protein
MGKQGEKILSLLTFKNSNIQDNMRETSSRNLRDSYRTSGARLGSRAGMKSSITNPVSNNSVKNEKISENKKQDNRNVQQNQIISGYFIKEKSYKEMVIARINNFLCGVLSLLVLVCLVSYYYVINGEIQLNQIRKETLAINYENEDMQHRLDILQSFSNVDKQVTKTKILQTAKQVMELSAANLPNVNYENKNASPVPGWSMGY